MKTIYQAPSQKIKYCYQITLFGGGYQIWIETDQGPSLQIGNLSPTVNGAQKQIEEIDDAYLNRVSVFYNQKYTFRKRSK